MLRQGIKLQHSAYSTTGYMCRRKIAPYCFIIVALNKDVTTSATATATTTAAAGRNATYRSPLTNIQSLRLSNKSKHFCTQANPPIYRTAWEL